MTCAGKGYAARHPARDPFPAAPPGSLSARAPVHACWKPRVCRTGPPLLWHRPRPSARSASLYLRGALERSLLLPNSRSHSLSVKMARLHTLLLLSAALRSGVEGTASESAPPPLPAPSPSPPPPLSVYPFYTAPLTDSGVGVYVGGDTVYSAGEGYLLANDTLGQLGGLMLSQRLSSTPCPAADGFSLKFQLSLSSYSAAVGANESSIADGFTLSFLDAKYYKARGVYAWTSGVPPAGALNMNMIAQHDVDGVIMFNTSGVMVVLDLYDNIDHASNPQVGFLARGVTKAMATSEPVVTTIATASGAWAVARAATGESVAHVIDYSAATDTLSYNVGGEWMFHNASTGGVMPSSFYVVFTANTGALTMRAVLSGPITVGCSSFPSPPQPPAPSPPPPRPRPPPRPKKARRNESTVLSRHHRRPR